MSRVEYPLAHEALLILCHSKSGMLKSPKMTKSGVEFRFEKLNNELCGLVITPSQ